MTTIGNEDFNKSNNASSWGSDLLGNAWSRVRGTSTFAISSNTGTVSGNSGSYCVERCGSGTSTDTEQVITFARSSTSDVAGLVFRYTDNNNWYNVNIGAYLNNLVFSKMVSGSYSDVSFGSSSTYATGTTWKLRVRNVGTSIKARIWDASTSEPGTWTIDTTDSSLSSAGGFGVVADPAGSPVISFDDYTATDAVTSTHSTQKYVGRFYQIAGTSKKFTSRFSQMAGATKKFAARFYQLTRASKKYSGRFSQLTGTSKKYAGRLFQTVLAQRKFSARFSQMTASQRKFVARLNHVTRVSKAFAARIYQYDRAAKQWSSRFKHTALAQRFFRSRLYQIAGTSKQFTGRFGHESLNSAVKAFTARFRQMTGTSKQYRARLAQSVISQRFFRSRLYQMTGASKRYATRFSQSARVARRFTARFGHIGDIDIIFAQQIYSWRFGHVARVSKLYTCRFGQYALPYAVGSGRDGRATGTGRDGAMLIGKGA